jgi:Phospholipase_D-nuclease N-terminal
VVRRQASDSGGSSAAHDCFGVITMVLAATGTGYPLLELFWTMLLIFGFVLWFWLLIVVFSDLFRRDDISGWSKAAWTVFMIVLPFIGVLTYLIAQGRSMADRRADEAAAARASFERDVRAIAGNGGRPTDQIATAKQLLDDGSITREEYAVLKRKVLETPSGTTAMPRA